MDQVQQEGILMSDFFELERQLYEQEKQNKKEQLLKSPEETKEEFTQETLERDPIVQTELPEPGTYSESDLVENDVAYNIIEQHMLDRFGIQAVENKSREDVVNTYINNRRGVAGGNTVRGLKEMDFLNDIKNDKVKMARTAKAYALFENMAGLYSGETTIGEKASGTVDYVRSAILDPINLVGGIVGKAVGGGSVRVANQAAQRMAIDAMTKAAASGASKEAVKKQGAKVFKKAIVEAGQQTRKNADLFTQKLLANRGFKRLATSGAMKEIAAVTTIEAAAAAGMDALYQNGLIMTDVQKEFSYGQMGIASLGSVIIGGIGAGRIMLRGEIGPKQAPLTASTEEAREKVIQNLTDELIKYSESKMPITRKWDQRVDAGEELAAQDTQFFVDLILGRTDGEGTILFKGISQIAKENDIFWVKDSDENIGNWLAEIIESSRPEDIDPFVNAFNKATGGQMKVVEGMTPKQLADTFANKSSQAGQMNNALSQAAKNNQVSLDELTVEAFVASEMNLPYNFYDRPIEDLDPPLSTKLVDMLPDSIVNTQNKIIRLLVANPATSYLNVVGWGAQTSMNTVTDMALATLHAGKGTIQKAFMQKQAGQENIRIARQLMQSTLFKGRTMLDPSLTRAQFERALTKNAKAMQALESTLPGGVENVSRLITKEGNFSKTTRMIDLKSEQFVDLIQAMTFVKAQDRVTKSIEFVSQMDKALRLKFDMGWEEFFANGFASKVMQTKEYANMEAQVVEKTLESIFSKSYKGPGVLGQLAGILEDARNIPGIGLLVPFGRFFNATIDFAIQASPLGVAGKLMGYYKDKTISEVAVKSLVGVTTVGLLVDDEYRKRKQGLGLYEEDIGGEVITQRYDYPISAFKAVARLISYYNYGEAPPTELLEQVRKDFTLSGLLRNLSETNQEMGEVIYHAFRLEMDEAGKQFKQAASGIGSQAISASTRFLEPANVVAGIVRGEDARPIDRRQGNRFVNNAFRYIDNIIPVFTGEPLGDVSQQAALGEADITTTRIMGIRPVRLTNTQRVMNIVGLPTYKLNALTKIRDQAPEAANEYNRIFFDVIEAKSTALMDKKAFRKLNVTDQMIEWKKVVRQSRTTAREFLIMQFQDDVLKLQYEITDKYSRKEIADARNSLEIEEDVEDLNESQLMQLKSYLKVKPSLDNMRINQQLRGN